MLRIVKEIWAKVKYFLLLNHLYQELILRASLGQNLGQIEMWKQKFPPLNFVNIKTVKYLDGKE